MPGLTLTVILQDIKKLETEALIVGFYEDVRPLKGLAGELDWLLCGSLSSLIIKNKLRGSLGEIALLTSRAKLPARKIFMVGLGPKEGLSSLSLRSAVRTAVSSALDAGVKHAAIEYFQPLNLPSPAEVSALQAGLAEGAGARSVEIALLAPDASAYEKISRLVKR
ncbi:MAG TPA: M17 family peptidase N-terminal domain-containing protein [Nitrospirota bacterium]|nr:M17 family peptidase N-terminal domain-containing protein [Nitrospirota bacterium]